ncbi:hypothetical protein FACS189472_01230 [Alphaproteobacteria bacterium]|nr:hypothetical protein FACS189472_01230 [Alphaproteobacteria bacterium]
MDMKEEIFGTERYDYIILEGIDLDYSFTYPAINGAFKLLRKEGKIVSSGIPWVAQRSSFEHLDATNVKKVNLGEGIYFVNKNTWRGDDLYIFVDEKKYPIYQRNPKNPNPSFFKNNASDILRFFGLDSTKAKIEFKMCNPGTDEWPKYKIGEDGHSVDECVLIMIITKLSD